MFFKDKKPVVLIHGCHLQAVMESENGEPKLTWEEITFGSQDPEAVSETGRVVAGIRLALMKKASRIIFSTGASERNGIKEGQYTLEEALRRTKAIAQHLKVPPERVRDLLTRRTLVDTETQNTAEELDRNLRIAGVRGARETYLVTSAWHAPRVTSEAAKIIRSLRLQNVKIPEVFIHAAPGSTRGTAVVEAPHRGDTPRSEHPLHALIPRLFRIPFAEREGVLRALEGNIEKAESARRG